MASFRCYDSSDVSAILIITNFPLYLIQLWWQFFPNACLWRRSLCSNLAGIDSEKLYRATFICQYGLFCCMALVSFRLFRRNLGNLQEFFGQMDYRPPWQKIARTPMLGTIKTCCKTCTKLSFLCQQSQASEISTAPYLLLYAFSYSISIHVRCLYYVRPCENVYLHISAIPEPTSNALAPSNK